MACGQFCALLSNDDDEGHAILYIVRQTNFVSARAFDSCRAECDHEFYCDGRGHRFLSNHVHVDESVRLREEQRQLLSSQRSAT